MTDSPPPVAIDGFDAVAYFEEGRAMKGSVAHEVGHGGSSWHFTSEAHARAFEGSPERYVPAYRGQCAFATSLGKAESGDPTKWAIRDGRLFLNSNAVAHLLWKLLPGRIAAGDRHWSSIS